MTDPPVPTETAPTTPPRPWRRRVRRVLAWSGGLVATVLASGLCVGCCVFSAPGYEGPPSDHFDGDVFHNSGERGGRWGDFLRWRMSRDEGAWPEWLEVEAAERPPERVGHNDVRVTFVNHATLLVQVAGLNVLTDPIWSERASPVSFAGPRRHHAPGVAFEDLPPIDAVVISHNHYDALDVPTLRRLAEEHSPRIYVGLGVAQYLEQEGIAGGRDMDWWDDDELAPGVTLTCVPAKHFSGRGLCDRDATLWCGYVVGAPGGNVFFAGDTGYGDHFAEIRERLGPVRAALLPIGSYRPRWFMHPMHMAPEEALRAHHDLGANTSVAIHYFTFPLGDDGLAEPGAELETALAAEGDDPARFWLLEPGEGRYVPTLDR